MLGGFVSWVTTGLLRSTGSLAQRGTGYQGRDTTDGCSIALAEAVEPTLRVWRPDSSMGTGIVNEHPGAACGVCGRGCLWAWEGVADTPRCVTRGGGERSPSGEVHVNALFRSQRHQSPGLHQ